MLKYDHEDDYHYTNELLLFDGDNYYWDSDWDEGQQDIHVVGYMPISQMDTFIQPNCTLYKDNTTSFDPLNKLIPVCGNCSHLILKDYKYCYGTCFYTHRIKSFYDECDHIEDMR